MIARAEPFDRDQSPQEDHFVHLHGATWADYERLLELRGDHSAPRIQYLEGTIEVFRLRSERYVKLAASVALRGIDLEQLASILDRPTTSQAIRDYRAALART